MPVSLVRLWLFAALLAAVGTTAHAADKAAGEQRALYKDVRQLIDDGKTTQASEKLNQLEGYALLPYLQADLLIASLDSLEQRQVDAFIEQHKGSVAYRKFLRPWLRHLASERDWSAFLRYYDTSVSDTTLRCHHAKALYASELHYLATAATQRLWLTGHSLPRACDAVLGRWLEDTGERDALVWKRARLAMDSEQHGLLSYLLELLPAERQQREVVRNPRLLGKHYKSLEANDNNRALAAFTLQRLATRDYRLAARLWPEIAEHFAFSDSDNYETRQTIARFMIASGDPSAARWLGEQDPDAEDEYLLEWQVRLALRNGHWQRVSELINGMPTRLRNQPAWRYWSARAHIALNEGRASAETIENLRELAEDRGFYSFLAADLLHQRYRMENERQDFTALIDQLVREPEMQRARELHATGDDFWARLEWNQALAGAERDRQAAAAQLAEHWGWHSQAIHGAIRGAYWNDLTLRFPLVYRESFASASEHNDLELHWLYAIARQESAFNRRARSPVGARGIMQLMPGTAREVAREKGQSFDHESLNDAETNIAWGAHYFRRMLERFGGNHVLAAAAYNIGPGTIERVLAEQARNYPFDVWIETLPYQETRNYLKSTLAFSVIYARQLERPARLVSASDRYIGVTTRTASASDGQTASSALELPLNCCPTEPPDS